MALPTRALQDPIPPEILPWLFNLAQVIEVVKYASRNIL
jgi:hypothetical protein